MSIYLSISKMCLCVEIKLARVSLTQSVQRSLKTQHYQQLPKRNTLDLWTGTLTLATSSLLWKQQWNSWHLLTNNEHIFPDFMDITLWILRKLAPKLTLWFVHNVCKWQEFSCFHMTVEAIFTAVWDQFWTKTSFSMSLFWGSNTYFMDDLDYLLCNVGVSFWFLSNRDPFFLGGVFSFFQISI